MRYCPTCKATWLSMTKCPRDGVKLGVEGGDPLLGQVIDQRYRILERIAAGGMGQVYRASHVRIASLCAVKVLYGELSVEADMCARFQREAEAASILQSRFITRVFDFGESEGGLPYLVMELLDGPTLTSAIARSGGLTEARALRIIRRVAVGLAHAHERGIVHRDLKPDNVVLVNEDDESDVPKILDFGIARIRERAGVTQAGQIMGTPAYMAPEQFTAGDIDARSDLYALGIILHEMLTGAVPFDAPSMVRYYEQHAKAEVPRLASAKSGWVPSAGVQELVDTLLAKQQADRYASAREVMDAIDQITSRVAEGPTRRTAIPLTREAQGPTGPAAAAVKIRGTIQQGAPLYNNGDTEGCARLYRQTAERLSTVELKDAPHAAMRARLQAALDRAEGKEAGRAAWELRYAFDDLLFAIGAKSARAAVPDEQSRFSKQCPERAQIVEVLDQAALMAARRYESGHPEVVGDFYCLLADALKKRLDGAKCCGAISQKLAEALSTAEDASGGADVAGIVGAAFDEVRFEGKAGELYELPPAEAAVLAASEQIDEVADAMVRAIGTGAAIYNEGDIDGCARLYQQTAEKLVASLPKGQKNTALIKLLGTAVSSAQKDASRDQAAWTLRHAFDAVLEARSIAKRPQSVSAVRRKNVPKR